MVTCLYFVCRESQLMLWLVKKVRWEEILITGDARSKPYAKSSFWYNCVEISNSQLHWQTGQTSKMFSVFFLCVCFFFSPPRSRKKKYEKLGRKKKCILCLLHSFLPRQCTIHHWSGRELQTNWNSKCIIVQALTPSPSAVFSMHSVCFPAFPSAPSSIFFIPSFWGQWRWPERPILFIQIQKVKSVFWMSPYLLFQLMFWHCGMNAKRFTVHDAMIQISVWN